MEINRYFDIAKKLLFPLHRSITGVGTLDTLKIIKKNFKGLNIKSIKSGTKVFDWRIPPQWDVNDAYVLDKDKKKLLILKKTIYILFLTLSQLKNMFTRKIFWLDYIH